MTCAAYFNIKVTVATRSGIRSTTNVFFSYPCAIVVCRAVIALKRAREWDFTNDAMLAGGRVKICRNMLTNRKGAILINYYVNIISVNYIIF